MIIVNKIVKINEADHYYINHKCQIMKQVTMLMV